jgi:hypothetical protein
MFIQMFTGHQITSCHIQENITVLKCSLYNEDVLLRVKEQRNILHEMRK